MDSLSGADVVADIRKLPFKDEFADAACAIHVIEHFYTWEVLDVLREWRRVLKTGGKLVLELPCMDKVARYIGYASAHGGSLEGPFTLNALFGEQKGDRPEMVHKWCYTAQAMADLLIGAGFRDVKLADARYHFPDRDMRLEAIK